MCPFKINCAKLFNFCTNIKKIDLEKESINFFANL